MTKQLTESLGLQSLEEALSISSSSKENEELEEIEKAQKELDDLQHDDPKSAKQYMDAYEKTRNLEKSLADHAGLKEHDIDMDNVAEEAMDSYKSLMDLAHNVAPAHSGKIFEQATQMLKISMDAKNAKSDKKLKMWRLQLEQARLMRDLERDRGTGPIDGTISEDDGTVVMTRNELFKQLKNKDA